MKKNIIKLFAMLTVLSLAAFPLIADGQKEITSDDPVKLELWSLLKGDRAKILDSQTEQFNASQDDVIVTVIHQGGYTPTKEKITAATSAGNLPAIIMIDYLDSGFYARQGILAPLDDLLSDKVKKEFFPGLMTDLTIDGTIYAIPYNRSTQGLYVNKELLAKAGIDAPPITWDEFYEQAKAVKTLGDDYYYAYSHFHQWFFDAIAYTWGNDLTTPEGRITLNENTGVEMMEFFQNMTNEGLLLIPPTVIGGFEEKSGAFMEGKVATILESTSWLATLDTVVDFDWKFAFLPAGDGGHAVTAGGGNFALTSHTSEVEQEAAALYFSFITSPEISADFHMNTGYMPTRNSVLDLPEVKEFHQINPGYLVSVEQLEYARPAPGYTRNVRGVWYRLTTGALAQILMNGEKPKTVLDAVAREFQGELDELIALDEYIR